MPQILEKAQSLLDWSIQHRRHLHQRPELSLEEKNTAAYCQEVLTTLGYRIKPSWGYGFTASLKAQPNQKTIALRADMDALPIQEKNQHDFVSKHPEVAHLCGHDVHMTIALTAARLLAEFKGSLAHNVRFIFQPSEERAPGGALGMIEQGCLAGVDEVYGLHNDPGTPVGHLRTRIGPLMAAADHFSCCIVGKGCHAARPQDGLDPLYVAASIIIDWQGIISRRINPAHPAVLSVTQFNSGTTNNVIPDQAELAGTIRTFTQPDRQTIETLMQAALLGWQQQGYQCELKLSKGYAPVINHQAGVERIAAAAKGVIASQHIDCNTEQAGWSEDFCYYLQHKPGAFFFLGSGNPSKGISAPLHASHFDIDEAVIPMGAAIMANLVIGN